MKQYLIIGAGPCGLAMAKALREAQIAYEQVEAAEGVGGNWLHGVYRSVYTDACKDVMQFPDFPMPAHYPDFLSQEKMLTYLQQYAAHFNLVENIRFRTRLVWLEAIEGNLWKAHFENADSRTCRGVIICNGHHWDSKMPEIPGSFGGTLIHAKAYKDPAQLKDQRVLVIGSGNSAADIACEAARVAACSVMSMRDSPWIFPKTFMGVPLGRMKLRRMPAFVDPLLVKLLLRLSFGKHEHYNLPAPRHKVFTKHPTVSEELPYYLMHGRIGPKPEAVRAEGKTVWFDDGTSMDFDLIVAATGYKLSFPFLPPELHRTDASNLRCIGHCVYPDYKGLYFLGWQQVRGGVGALATPFSKLIANLIALEDEYRLPAGKIFERLNERISTTHLYGSKEVFAWLKRNDDHRLQRAARAVHGKIDHRNAAVGARPKPVFQSGKIS